MKLAILGADRTTLALAKAVHAAGDHEIVVLCQVDGAWRSAATDRLLAAAPLASRTDDWESLLDNRVCSAVLVAAGEQEDARSEQLRKLVQAGQHVLAAHPVVYSDLLYYELEMIRGDTGSALVPFLPDRTHPAVRRVSELLSGASPLGVVEQITLERQQSIRDKRRTLSMFAQDVDLLRALCGEILRVGAMGAGADDAAYANIGVQMSAANGTLIRWSVGPVTAAEGGRLMVAFEHGQCVLQMPEGDGPWLLETNCGENQTTEETHASRAETALGLLVGAIAGNRRGASWLDAARSLEVAAMIPRSLKRGKTIDLRYEEHPEKESFKGTMSAVGCGLLLLSLGLFAAATLLESIGLPLPRNWPWMLLLAVLALFLLLQLLAVVIPKSAPRSDAEDGKPGGV